MTANAGTFATFDGAAAPDRKLFHLTFAGPESGFAAALQAALRNPLTAASFAEQLGRARARVRQRCAETDDPSLPLRWAGIDTAVRFLLEGTNQLLVEAVEHFDAAFRSLGIRHPRPYESPPPTGLLSPALHKFFAERSVAGASSWSPFAPSSSWTAGTYLLHDWLMGQVVGKSPAISREATPVLSVIEDDSGSYWGSVQRLVVEQLDGPSGLVTPDFFAFGLVEFPAGTEGHFVGAMQQAFAAALGRCKTARLRWYLEPVLGDFPSNLGGRSAQVAAASCVLALAEPNRTDAEPLLDERTAVTACLGRAARTLQEWPIVPFEIPAFGQNARELAEVEGKKLNAKFEAAAHARLTAVLVCEAQVPQTPEYTVKFKDGQQHTVLIQPARSLEEAYDSLLVTSRAIAQYKASIVQRWEATWEERRTPEEFTRGRQSNE